MRYTSRSANETKASAYIKNMSEVHPPAAVTKPVVTHQPGYAKLANRVEEFMATRIDLAFYTPKPCSGRPAGSRIEEDENGEFHLVCPT